MCTVDKVLIKGIRSFGPTNEDRIEFDRPLTVIVGSNGAGKTTIIECLRNATTGELPPNTRQGQGFVHDPKVAGESEVKAQIKLSFKTATGQEPIYVTRSFQLTQKKTALQFKSLDAVLSCRNRNTGLRESVTYRCADLDRMVPTLMGVSKAILENVVFVHQEESNWPLAEGKVLKDKFDDIFSATKYTKALEALRKLRTEKGAALREYKLSLETLRQVRDMAAHHAGERDAAQGRVADCSQQLAGFEAKIKDLDEQRSAVAARLAEVDSLTRGLGSRRGQLEQLRATNREREERFRSEGREEFEESDSELRSHLADADRLAGEKTSRLRALEAETNNARIAKEALADQYQRGCLRQGKLAGEAASHAANVAERDKAIRATAVALSLPLPPEEPAAGGGAAGAAGEDGGAAGDAAGAAAAAAAAGGGAGSFSSAAAEAFRDSAAARVWELKERLEEARAELEATQDRLRPLLMAADDAVVSAHGAQDRMEHARRKNELAIASARAQIQSSQVTEASARALREDADRAEELHRRKQAEEAGSELPRAVAEARSEVEAAGRRIGELRAERQRAAAEAEGAARLRLKRTDLVSKEEQLHKVLSARRLDLSRALELPPGEPMPPASGLRARSEAVLGRLRAEEAERLAASQVAHRAAEAAKTQLASRSSEAAACRADLDRLRAELRTGMAAALGEAVAGAQEDEFNNKLAAVQKSEDKRRNRLGRASAMQTLFGSYRETVAGGQPCPVCRRGFSDQERADCLRHIEQDMQALPASIAECQASLAALQRQLEALRALQPAWVRSGDLRARLPGLEAGEAALRARVEELEERAGSAQLDYAEASERVREAARLQTDCVWGLDRLAAEVEGLRREIARLEASSAAGAGGAAVRSVSDIDAELEAVEAARQRAEMTRDAAQQRVNRLHEEVLSAQRAAISAQQRALEAAAEVQQFMELQKKISELEAANASLDAEFAAASPAVASLEAHRDKTQRKLRRARKRDEAAVAAAEEQLREAQLAAAQLSSRVRTVSEYESRGRAAKLAQAGAELAALRGRMEAAAAELAAKEEEARAIHKALASDVALRREMSDVLDMRAARAAEAALAAEVAEAEARVAQVGDPALLSRQAASLGEQRDALRSRQDQLRGQMAAAQAAAARAAAELDTDKFRDIGGRYTSQQLSVKITEMALGDMDKYYKALEKALLCFHSSKMADINKIIRELWQKTYRGQDIDYIAIKADTEGAGARSYNYRVVMYSGSAELEMRGRCSAGQKVLACLIIRLALAETFCLNCGILALDEPTTNLDAENSASLARALKALMESRSAQENFQLIVITHDETFAHLIGTREHVERLWRVTKDPATQHTLVTEENVQDWSGVSPWPA